MRYSFVCGIAALAAAGAMADGASASQSTATMSVSINITAACQISVVDINFGATMASTLATALSSTPAMGGLVTYDCASNNTPSLTASQGQYFSSANRMKGNTLGGFIPYSLSIPPLAAFSGQQQSAQVTATIPAQGTLPAVDNYVDSVVLTLTY